MNKVFRALDQLEQVPTAAAYCQARQKLQPEVFAYLNQQAVTDFYALSAADGSLYRWHGHRVLGADGTTLNLPDSPTVRAAFSVIANQHTEYVQGTAVVLYDLGNDLGLAASLGPVSSETAPLLQRLWDTTHPGDVVVLDRNFAEYEVIVHAQRTARDVVIRCPRPFKAVKAFWSAPARDQVVDLTIPDTPKCRDALRAQRLPASVAVRLLKFRLPSGETEVLLTTLCDRTRYPAAEFYSLYGRRWGKKPIVPGSNTSLKSNVGVARAW